MAPSNLSLPASANTSQPDADSAREIAPQIWLERLCEGRIIVFTIRTNSRASLEVWFQTCRQIMDEWPRARPFLMLSDLVYEGAAFTPTVKSYTAQLASHRPELAQFVAVVMTKTFLVQLAVYAMKKVRNDKMDTQIFFSREEGLNWLKSKL